MYVLHIYDLDEFGSMPLFHTRQITNLIRKCMVYDYISCRRIGHDREFHVPQTCTMIADLLGHIIEDELSSVYFDDNELQKCAMCCELWLLSFVDQFQFDHEMRWVETNWYTSTFAIAKRTSVHARIRSSHYFLESPNESSD